MIVIVTHIDSKTGTSVEQATPVNGPMLPNLPGLTVRWSKSSRYPSRVPEFVCDVTTGDYTGVPGVLRQLSAEEEAAEYAQELQDRDTAIVNATAAPVVRKRNELLMLSDKYMLSDFPLTPEEKLRWQEYRQLLRDLTLQETFPYSVSWPIAP
jgi:hypothetical protein